MDESVYSGTSNILVELNQQLAENDDSSQHMSDQILIAQLAAGISATNDNIKKRNRAISEDVCDFKNKLNMKSSCEPSSKKFDAISSIKKAPSMNLLVDPNMMRMNTYDNDMSGSPFLASKS